MPLDATPTRDYTPLRSDLAKAIFDLIAAEYANMPWPDIAWALDSVWHWQLVRAQGGALGDYTPPVTPPDPTKATVSDGQQLPIKAGTKTLNGLATVANSAVTLVQMGSTVALVQNTDPVTVVFADGSTEAEGSPGGATVTAGNLANVKLTV